MRTIGTTRTAAPGTSPDVVGPDLVGRIMDDFHIAISELRCAGTERLVKAGVSMTHLHVMGLLSRHGEVSMSRIAELLDVSLSNATGLIDRMAERGLIERVRVPDDRRIVLVRLSQVGQDQLDALEIVRRDMILKILTRLDPTQLARLSQSLADVHEAVSDLLATEGAEALGLAHEHAPVHTHAHGHGYPEATSTGRTVAH